MNFHFFDLRLSLVIISVFTTVIGFSQTIWNGPWHTYTKENNANWNLEENQDRITDDIWITRRNSQGIFNIATENFYSMNVSPSGTEWSFGTTAEIEILTFSDWRTAIDANPPGMIDQSMVLHLIEEDIYMDIIFVSWQQNSGGGVSYKRRTANSVGIEDLPKSRPALVFPNPTSDELRVSSIHGTINFQIVDYSGIVVRKGRWDTTLPLDIAELSSGLYFIRTDKWSAKWLKED